MTYSAYIICTSPRSGSTLLCRMLRQTGCAGHPGSHFHDPSLDAWMAAYGLRRKDGETESALLGRVFEAAIAKGRGSTNVFGLRLQRQSFQYFSEKLRVLCPGMASDADRIAQAFRETAFIHLRREDKVAQAVSYVKAQQSGLWHRSADGTELERLSPPGVLAYDGDTLKRQVDLFAANDIAWNDWFEREQIDPLRLTYEDLSADPLACVQRVLDLLGIDRHAARGVEPDTAILSDPVSRDWAARLRKENI